VAIEVAKAASMLTLSVEREVASAAVITDAHATINASVSVLKVDKAPETIEVYPEEEMTVDYKDLLVSIS